MIHARTLIAAARARLWGAEAPEAIAPGDDAPAQVAAPALPTEAQRAIAKLAAKARAADPDCRTIADADPAYQLAWWKAEERAARARYSRATGKVKLTGRKAWQRECKAVSWDMTGTSCRFRRRA